jgi:hypothetical protein
MAGTLTISTLSDGTNSTSSTNCIQGSAKAWVQFTGSTATINNSFNVSSVTRSSTGSYVVNYTTALPVSNYASAGMLLNSSYNASNAARAIITSALTTTTATIYIVAGSGSAEDGGVGFIAICS